MRIRPVHLGVAAAAGVAVGGTAAFLWARQHRGAGAGAGPAAAAPHPALKHGTPLTSHLRVFSSYVAEYDPRLRNPRYVLEHFTADVLRGGGDRAGSLFKEDAALDPRFRAQLSDFRGSGYDRGHMAPAANHKRSQQAMDETFSLTNVSPQVGAGFNRDYWARFERFVQETAQRCEDVYVVTGPLWLPTPRPGGDGAGGAQWVMQHAMLGAPPRLVGVPTHFFKVVLGEGAKNGGGDVVGAFVMPNAAIDPATPLASFSVPVSSLEEVSGISFFPKFLNDRKRAALDGASLGWQRQGRADAAQRRLAGAPAPPLLPAPLGEAGTGAGTGTGAGLVTRPLPPGLGMQHLCEHSGCKLPAERWWETGKKAKDLRRTKSSPALGVTQTP